MRPNAAWEPLKALYQAYMDALRTARMAGPTSLNTDWYPEAALIVRAELRQEAVTQTRFGFHAQSSEIHAACGLMIARRTGPTSVTIRAIWLDNLWHIRTGKEWENNISYGCNKPPYAVLTTNWPRRDALVYDSASDFVHQPSNRPLSTPLSVYPIRDFV